MFGTKEFDGVGYPTPSSIPVETAYRLAKVPADASWLAVFMGMLEVGLSEENWQQFEGGITREAAVEVWMQIISDMYAFAENPTILMDVRQNPTLPCILEKTFDGSTWEQFADLQKCPPVIRRAANGQYQPGAKLPDGSFGYFDADEGPWTTDIWDSFSPSAPMIHQTNDKCVAAANAANVIRKLYEEVGKNLVSESAVSFASTAAGIAGELAQTFLVSVATDLIGTILPALYVIQQAYAFTSMSDADFRTLACAFYNNMSGTDGNWTSNTAGLTTAINALATSNPVPFLLIRELLVFIGDTGVNLSFKTTEITDYDCSANTQNMYFATVKGRWYTQAVNGQAYLSLPLPGNLGLVRWRPIGGWVAGAVSASANSQTLAQGYSDGNYASGQVTAMGATNQDLWWYDSVLYPTKPDALAAIRDVMGDPTYTPSSYGNMGSGHRVAGQQLQFNFQFNTITVNHWQPLQWDVWYNVSFPGC